MFTTVTVTGTLHTPDNQPARGTIYFKLSGDIADTSSSTVVVPATISVVLDGSGHFSQTLVATNDTTSEPSDRSYRVTKQIDGAELETFDVVLDKAFAPTVDLSSLEP